MQVMQWPVTPPASRAITVNRKTPNGHVCKYTVYNWGEVKQILLTSIKVTQTFKTDIKETEVSSGLQDNNGEIDFKKKPSPKPQQDTINPLNPKSFTGSKANVFNQHFNFPARHYYK